jgi:KDO2-lipid IV(A) lauroyltransferase
VQQPSRIHKSRDQRPPRRGADQEDRKPFARVPWWVRALSSLPLPAWYGFARFLYWLSEYVVRHRRGVIDMQLAACFPERDAAWLRDTRRGFYRNSCEVAVEVVKAATISREEVDRRVTFEGDAAARAALAGGQSIMVVTSHNCNWEWTLLKLSALGYPLHVAYKPLKGRFGDELMLTVRSRFGAEMIAAKRLLMRVIRYRGPPRIVAIAADQAPTASGVRYFTRFMGLDTAFFVGPEAIARAAGLPVFFLAMRRLSQGHYCVGFVPLSAAGEELAEGALLERYAAALEALTREHPADWLWSYRRWKVKRDAQGNPTVDRTGFVSHPLCMATGVRFIVNTEA